MDKQYLEIEFNTFFEFDSDDRSVVTSTSAKMFAEHMAMPIEAQVEQLNLELQKRDKCSFMGPMRDCPTHGESAELAALREAVKPFAAIFNETSGRIPTERLSLANWYDLVKAFNKRPNVEVTGGRHERRDVNGHC